MSKDLHHFPYKIQLAQALHPEDKQAHLEYTRAFINLTENEENFISNLTMSHEAHFQLSGFVSKQNCRFWGSANVRIIHQRPLHPGSPGSIRTVQEKGTFKRHLKTALFQQNA